MVGNKTIRCGAVVLAAGSGKRMQSAVKKQFLPLCGKPVLYYSLQAFQDSFVDKIVLVVSGEDLEYCKKEIVETHHFSKVCSIAEGGEERYHSVAAGLNCLPDCDYIFIHDGARPMLTKDILERAYAGVKETDACIVGMPVKDTVKIADKNNFIESTPDRSLLWAVQTPQVFSSSLIKGAYDRLLAEEENLKRQGVCITDDAMVVETLMGHPVKLTEGSYENIKITTPEDLVIAEKLLERRSGIIGNLR